MLGRKEIVHYAQGTHKDPDSERTESTSQSWEEPEEDSNWGSKVLP